MDRGRCPRLAGGLAGAPKAADPHTQTTGPASPPPHFLLPAAPSHPPGPLASSDAPEPWRGSRAGVGVKKGRRSLAVRLGGRKRSPAPASLLPASRANLSSRRFHPGPREAQCPQKRRKGAGSARPRVLWTPHFGGSCSQSYLPPLDTPHPKLLLSGVGSVSTEARTHQRVWLYSWQRVRCVRLAQRTGPGSLQDPPASAPSA